MHDCSKTGSLHNNLLLATLSCRGDLDVVGVCGIGVSGLVVVVCVCCCPVVVGGGGGGGGVGWLVGFWAGWYHGPS